MTTGETTAQHTLTLSFLLSPPSPWVKEAYMYFRTRDADSVASAPNSPGPGGMAVVGEGVEGKEG